MSWEKAVRALASALLVLSLLAVAGLLAHTAAGRLGYPFDLEWMEGGMLVHALRVLRGQPLYVDPSPDFIPFIYPPLYPWLLGLLAHIFGLSYALGRAVSLLGTLVAAGLMVLAVRREGMGWSLGLGAAALFLSTYDEAGAFFDLVRADGLLVALLAGTLVACRRATPGSLRLGGLLLVLAFATKQSYALLGLPILLSLWLGRGRRPALTFAAWSVLPALAFTAVLAIVTRGRFLAYALWAPATHPLVAERLFPGSEKELLSAFPWALGAGLLAALLAGPRSPRRWGFPALYWLSNLATGLLLTVLMRGHHGGFLNVLIPGYWLLALGAALGLGLALRRWPHPLLALGVALLVAFQAWEGRWEPSRYLPTERDRAAGEELLEVVRSYPGPVLMPHSPYYPVLAGKEPCFHLIALWDLGHRGSPFPDAGEEVERALAEQRYDAVIVASRKLGYGLAKHYRLARTLRFEGRALMPKTGWRARPRFVYERK